GETSGGAGGSTAALPRFVPRVRRPHPGLYPDAPPGLKPRHPLGLSVRKYSYRSARSRGGSPSSSPSGISERLDGRRDTMSGPARRTVVVAPVCTIIPSAEK